MVRRYLLLPARYAAGFTGGPQLDRMPRLRLPLESLAVGRTSAGNLLAHGQPTGSTAVPRGYRITDWQRSGLCRDRQETRKPLQPYSHRPVILLDLVLPLEDVVLQSCHPIRVDQNIRAIGEATFRLYQQRLLLVVTERLEGQALSPGLRILSKSGLSSKPRLTTEGESAITLP